MPNHVANYVIITGNPTDLEKFWKKATTDEKTSESTTFDYKNLFPIPYGTSWYDFCVKYWGNKWGSYEVEENVTNDDIQKGEISFKYNTAWNISTPFWINITGMFNIQVHNYFHDECDNFCGEEIYKDASVIKRLFFTDPSKYPEEYDKYEKICEKNISSDSNNSSDESDDDESDNNTLDTLENKSETVEN
jgi:hypothetical protein